MRYLTQHLDIHADLMWEMRVGIHNIYLVGSIIDLESKSIVQIAAGDSRRWNKIHPNPGLIWDVGAPPAQRCCVAGGVNCSIANAGGGPNLTGFIWSPPGLIGKFETTDSCELLRKKLCPEVKTGELKQAKEQSNLGRSRGKLAFLVEVVTISAF
jgi:hypothetical protein